MCDKFTLFDFLEMCRDGYFLDCDGHGYYGTEEKEDKSKIVKPSNLLAHIIDKSFTHVYWYNK
jgi:hypothetical protein